ncbi:LysR substrate-binding domain-containing protein [Hahella aquimaris]|uniref:LysR family transcriptional regulator n=1 Tax=Hahella sp. HNIBRBA332 TaxID=3015983 RepID=UPI00273C7C3C|nr:LysR family transcriptional regulator [Hahella sp. HNIBRBA332]WLQ16346.1 LysR substrate-binding domain-containing protein [Hahella sp. HNIBRBA332]
MDKLRAMQYLLKVADTLSFSRAAKSFGVPASSISRRIADLEADLGVELLHRTTRTVRLTEIGVIYVEHVRSGVAQLDDAEEMVSLHSRTPSGTLRISAMPSFSQLLLPAVIAFNERYPDILLDLHFSDAVVEMGRERIDIAIRSSLLTQERVVARKIHSHNYLLAASPEYLKRNGTPRTLEDLQDHPALLYRGPSSVLKWYGQDADGWYELPISPLMISNDGATLVAMACQHRGLVLLPQWGLEGYVKRGELTPIVLNRPISVRRGTEASLYLMYLHARYQIPKVKLAADFLFEHLTLNSTDL